MDFCRVQALCIYGEKQNLYMQCYGKSLQERFDGLARDIKAQVAESINTTLQIYYYTPSSSEAGGPECPVVYRKIGEINMFLLGDPFMNEMFLITTVTTISLAINQVVGVNPTEQGFLDVYSKMGVVLGEIISDGMVITDEVPDIMQYEQNTTSAFKTFISGAKFIAKTFIN